MLWDAGVPYYQGQHQSSMAMNTIAQRLEQGDFFLLDSRENAFDGIQFFGDISPFVSPLFRNRIKRLAPRPQVGSKQGLGEAAYGPPPEEPGLQSVTVLPIEWVVEGIADSVEQLSTMLETGPTLAGAATMAVALIPGKVADKALEPVVKKLDNVEVPSNKALTVAKASVMKKHKVACFKKNSKGSDIEYDRQLQGQQDGINKMSVKEYLDNRESYKAIGRTGTGPAQDKARKDFQEDLIDTYRKQLREKGVFGQEALDKATELALNDMKTLNALHNPDMIAGGNDVVFDLGDASVNQSIGSQWKTKGGENLSRVDLMDIEAQKALEELGPDTLMDVNLHRCK